VRALVKSFLALPPITAIALIPWTVGVATQLPDLALAHHWNTAWVGLDVAIAIGLALTTWLSHRRNPRSALVATATATLMCTDAWFDVCTSAPGSPFAYAAAEGAIELVVAAACLFIGLRSHRDEVVPGESPASSGTTNGVAVPSPEPDPSPV
jgi:hypothetical protein